MATAVLLAALGGWFVFLRPMSLGGPVDYVVVRGTSMLPAFESGDLVIVREKERYAPGDVIAYRVPAGEIGAGHVVIHRLVALRDGRWIVQGDNNDAVDPWMPSNADIVGAPVVHLPVVGRVLAAVHQPAVLGALAAALAVMAMLWRRPDRAALRRPEFSPSPR